MAFDVENSCPCFWDSLLCLSRVWGLLTAAEKLPEAAKAVLKKTIPRIQKAAKAPDNPSTSSSASSPAAIPTPPAADITSQPASSSAPPEAASTQPSAAKQQDNAPALNTDRILDRVRPGDSVGHVAASSCLPKCRRAQRLPNGGEADEGDPAGVALRGGGLVSVVLKWCEGPSRKGVLYAVLGAVVLLWPHQHLWLSPVAGLTMSQMRAQQMPHRRGRGLPLSLVQPSSACMVQNVRARDSRGLSCYEALLPKMEKPLLFPAMENRCS
ncbi:uncharacterized protein LOC124160108 isoform X2 [Ischnura elegans]|uniref:uncharacterized protein LOC124160108 isoform X2 n=1 Tax=Ischnura elegans TaxID=197161 RepID=UPI001ED87A07|nr:uncharacterized protein LOC124160108 isoform X2 [Ischnura elegans]